MQQKQSRLAHCKVMMSVVDYQAGVSTIQLRFSVMSLLLAMSLLQMSLNILQLMTLKAGNTCRDAIEALQQMVGGARMQNLEYQTPLATKTIFRQPWATDGGLQEFVQTRPGGVLTNLRW